MNKTWVTGGYPLLFGIFDGTRKWSRSRGKSSYQSHDSRCLILTSHDYTLNFITCALKKGCWIESRKIDSCPLRIISIFLDGVLSDSLFNQYVRVLCITNSVCERKSISK